jgi:hypothetical protein
MLSWNVDDQSDSGQKSPHSWISKDDNHENWEIVEW